MLRWAIGLCALGAASAHAQGPFSFDAFARDPGGYVSARYPRGAAARELRADLEAAGFECRDAYASEAETLISACERIDQTRRQCFITWRVAIRPGAEGAAVPEVASVHRCRGVLSAPMRRTFDRGRYLAAGGLLLGGPD
jgi:hypothetical protein